MVKFLTNLGLYLHIPFCKKKCAYCDFYSGVFTEESAQKYLDALKREIKQWGGKINRPIDTIYLGGGTPSLIHHHLPSLIDCIKQNFSLAESTEITLEVNPQGDMREMLENAKSAGVNRLSIGAQSGNDKELSILGRTHCAQETKTAVETARELGFDNISLDLMIGLPHSDNNSLKANLDFLVSLNPEHISAYILKIEPRTAFYKLENTLAIPDDDAVSEQYLFMCEYLESRGFSHYEISNFAKEGMTSRHNLKYWHCEEYLGIGPSAHSFLDGKRFYYPRDIKLFLEGTSPIPDGDGGSDDEKLMLALRLKEGVSLEKLPKQKTDLFIENGLAIAANGNFVLTNKGMLVSNQIITELLEN